jgi:DNA replication protein DnaC
VILTGPTGTGKTFQAWAWWRRWAFYATRDRVPDAQFYTAADLLERIRKSYDGERIELVPSELLVIDDLGVERPTEWVSEQLYRIVDERYRNCLPLFVTTNLTGVQLRDRLGDRLVSRLAEMCISVRLDGKDRRLVGKSA